MVARSVVLSSKLAMLCIHGYADMEMCATKSSPGDHGRNNTEVWIFGKK